jgi:hypothetical protein
VVPARPTELVITNRNVVSVFVATGRLLHTRELAVHWATATNSNVTSRYRNNGAKAGKVYSACTANITTIV